MPPVDKKELLRLMPPVDKKQLLRLVTALEPLTLEFMGLTMPNENGTPSKEFVRTLEEIGRPVEGNSCLFAASVFGCLFGSAVVQIKEELEKRDELRKLENRWRENKNEENNPNAVALPVRLIMLAYPNADHSAVEHMVALSLRLSKSKSDKPGEPMSNLSNIIDALREYGYLGQEDERPPQA